MDATVVRCGFGHDADDARELALSSLEQAAKHDKDAKVKSTAATALRVLASVRKSAKSTISATPAVFVNIDRATVATLHIFAIKFIAGDLHCSPEFLLGA